jgi:hypothetical protein
MLGPGLFAGTVDAMAPGRRLQSLTFEMKIIDRVGVATEIARTVVERQLGASLMPRRDNP